VVYVNLASNKQAVNNLFNFSVSGKVYSPEEEVQIKTISNVGKIILVKIF